MPVLVKRSPLVTSIRQSLLRFVRSTYGLKVFYIRNREEFPFIANNRNLLGEGVEIGVWKGEYSHFLLSHWKGRTLYSVDPWKSFIDQSYKDDMNIEQQQFDGIHDGVKQLLAPFGSRSQIVRKLSSEAAPMFRDGQLDFVYIDAQHHYEAVKEDIGLWFPKVKKGGILAGHDYLDGKIDNSEFGVKKAVDEFAKENNLKLLVGDRDDYRSWFIFK